VLSRSEIVALVQLLTRIQSTAGFAQLAAETRNAVLIAAAIRYLGEASQTGSDGAI
jgi:hypothetical protein